MQEKKWHKIWEVIQTILILLLMIPIAIVGFLVFAVMAQSITAVFASVAGLFLFGIIAIALYEWVTGNRVKTDFSDLMNSKFLIVTLFIIGGIIGLIMLYNMFIEPMAELNDYY